MDFIRFFKKKPGETPEQYNDRLVRSLNALGSRVQGDVSSGIEGLESRVEDLELVTTVIDLTSASSDYTLSVNETAKINITAASTPLNIAISAGKYEIDILFDVSTFAANSVFGIQANNAASVGNFIRFALKGSTTFATDEIDVSIAAQDSHAQYDETGKPVALNGHLIIMGSISHLTANVSFLDSAGNPGGVYIN